MTSEFYFLEQFIFQAIFSPSKRLYNRKNSLQFLENRMEVKK